MLLAKKSSLSITLPSVSAKRVATLPLEESMILKEGNTILVAKINATTPVKAGRRCFYVPPTRLKVGNYVR